MDPVDRNQAIDRVSGFLEGNRVCTIFAANPEKNFSVPKDTNLYATYRNADLLIPDGIGIVLAARILHSIVLERIPGVEFMHDICRLAETKARSVFIYGAKEPINQRSVEKLRLQFPSLRIAGRSNGYVSESEMPDLIQRINDSRADILFLALGSPKQEHWIATYASKLNHVCVCQGIGGTLDTIAGTVKRAPGIWQKLSLEWLYRLLSDPRRIRRQRVLPLFAFRVLMAKVRSAMELK